MECRLYITPEDIHKQGISTSLADHFKISSEDILAWESKYQSICYYFYGQLPKIEDYVSIELCAMDAMQPLLFDAGVPNKSARDAWLHFQLQVVTPQSHLPNPSIAHIIIFNKIIT